MTEPMPKPGELWAMRSAPPFNLLSGLAVVYAVTKNADETYDVLYRHIFSDSKEMERTTVDPFTKDYAYLGLIPIAGERWVENINPEKIETHPVKSDFIDLLRKRPSDTLNIIQAYNKICGYIKNRHPRPGEVWVHNNNPTRAEVKILLPFPDVTVRCKFLESPAQGYIPYDEHDLAIGSFLSMHDFIPAEYRGPRNRKEDMAYLGKEGDDYRFCEKAITEDYIWVNYKWQVMSKVSTNTLRQLKRYILNHPLKKHSLLWLWQVEIIKDAIAKR